MNKEKRALERTVQAVYDLIEQYWDELGLTEEEREERMKAFVAKVDEIKRKRH